jgi:hypothetical protein
MNPSAGSAAPADRALTWSSVLSTDAQPSAATALACRILESQTNPSILCDVLWCGLLFVVAWVIFFAAYVAAARLRWVKNVDWRLIALAVLSAIATGILSWLVLWERFSSPNAFWLATIAAPIAFIGYCGIFILTGPTNVDRSVTFSMLRAFKALEGRETQNGPPIDAVGFDRIFNKRIRELSMAGVIEVQGGRVRLTPLGDRTRRFYLWLGRLLNVEPQ